VTHLIRFEEVQIDDLLMYYSVVLKIWIISIFLATIIISILKTEKKRGGD